MYTNTLRMLSIAVLYGYVLGAPTPFELGTGHFALGPSNFGIFSNPSLSVAGGSNDPLSNSKRFDISDVINNPKFPRTVPGIQTGPADSFTIFNDPKFNPGDTDVSSFREIQQANTKRFDISDVTNNPNFPRTVPEVKTSVGAESGFTVFNDPEFSFSNDISVSAFRDPSITGQLH